MRTQRLPSLLFGSILTLAAGCALRQVAFASATPARTPAEVTVYRDAKGVPHIFAADSAAVMYGLGYSIAQDRLAQMELGLRGVQGRRSEILGPSSLEGDETARDRLLSAEELTRMYGTLSAEYQAMMQAFVDGINHQVPRWSKIRSTNCRINSRSGVLSRTAGRCSIISLTWRPSRMTGWLRAAKPGLPQRDDGEARTKVALRSSRTSCRSAIRIRRPPFLQGRISRPRNPCRSGASHSWCTPHHLGAAAAGAAPRERRPAVV